MDNLSLAFRPATKSEPELPLSRFLPPYPPGSFHSWLMDNSRAGDWILDPLCSSPGLALEAGACGRRVLVTCNNPILTLAIEVLASAPKSSEFTSALSHLADTHRGSERLESHLQSLYTTVCPSCGQIIPAEAFIWKRGDSSPHLRLYRCRYCKNEGEASITDDDIKQLQLIGNASLHRARAMERVNIGENEFLEAAQEGILAYTPRQLYFIQTILNKIEGLDISADQKKLLYALSLTVCDEGNALWAYPSIRQRPKQILIPPEFRENNLWLSLEKSILSWCRSSNPIPVTRYPNLPPPSGGICIFPERLRNLSPFPEDILPKGVIALLPRPNQAFWTFSAIWAGWIWGSQAVTPLKVGLERRRYDWEWHTFALKNLFDALHRICLSPIKIFGMASELVPGFLSAILLAASSSGYYLDAIALRPTEEMVQVVWNSEGREQKDIDIEQAIDRVFLDSNEPQEYLVPFTSALIVKTSHPDTVKEKPQETISQFQNSVNRILANPNRIKRFESTAQNMESGRYWLSIPPSTDPLPLIDRIEIELVNYLQLHPEILFENIEAHLCRMFTGLLTPSNEVIREILSSYAEEVHNQPGMWKLRPQETSSTRRADLQMIKQIFEKLGSQFCFQITTQPQLCWMDKDQKPVQYWHPIASAIISRYIYDPKYPQPSQHIIILPGSRSQLVSYKIKRDARLQTAIAKGWLFIKYRYLRHLAEQPGLNFETWNSLVNGDPIHSEEVTQMSMFS
jgi:hypothetical protein